MFDFVNTLLLILSVITALAVIKFTLKTFSDWLEDRWPEIYLRKKFRVYTYISEDGRAYECMEDLAGRIVHIACLPEKDKPGEHADADNPRPKQPLIN